MLNEIFYIMLKWQLGKSMEPHKDADTIYNVKGLELDVRKIIKKYPEIFYNIQNYFKLSIFINFKVA